MSVAQINRSRHDRFTFVHETRGALEPLRLMAQSPKLVRRARHPAPVIVLPGLGANDVSTTPLRWYLERTGHRVTGWELGIHGPRVMTTLNRFMPRLEAACIAAGGPITLIGWSLGGVVARETARDRPDLVEQVITFGSPILGGFVQTSRRQRPIRVPVTTIYSRRDGVVDWRNAIDDHTPTVVNVEVSSSHIGLGIDPDVWRIIVDTIDSRGDATQRGDD